VDKDIDKEQFNKRVGDALRLSIAARALCLLLWHRDKESLGNGYDWLNWQLNGGADDVQDVHNALDEDLASRVSRELLTLILERVEQVLGRPMALFVDEAQILLLDSFGKYPWPTPPAASPKSDDDVSTSQSSSMDTKDDKPNSKQETKVLKLPDEALFLHKLVMELCEYRLHLVFAGTYFRLPTATVLARAVSAQFKLLGAGTSMPQVHLIESFPWIVGNDRVWGFVECCLNVIGVF